MASGRRSAVSVMVAPGGEKPTALDSRLNRICRMRRSSATKLPMSGAAWMSSDDVVLDQAILDAFGGGLHGLADVDRAEIERHRAGVDGGEIEDVVDDREQRVGRGGDVAEIFALLVGERAGRGLAEEMREADDVGERRAQLVGDVVDEIDLELVGGFQRLVALAQRALDIDRVGDVEERDERGAVRQRHGDADRPRCRRGARAGRSRCRGSRSR